MDYYTTMAGALGMHGAVRAHCRPWLTPKPCQGGMLRYSCTEQHLERSFTRRRVVLHMPNQAMAKQRDIQAVEDAADEWEWEAEPEYGPAFEATLRMLDWPGLTAQVWWPAGEHIAVRQSGTLGLSAQFLTCPL